MATTYSPTCSGSSRAQRDRGEILGAFDLEHGKVEPRVATFDLRLELALVGELHPNGVRALDDVRVGHDVTLRRRR